MSGSEGMVEILYSGGRGQSGRSHLTIGDVVGTLRVTRGDGAI